MTATSICPRCQGDTVEAGRCIACGLVKTTADGRRYYGSGLPSENRRHLPGGLHPDAWMVMTYACEDCGRSARIWNARNGVAPFLVPCWFCNGGMMAHQAWHEDVRERDRVPAVGDRVMLTINPHVARDIDVRFDADVPMLATVEGAAQVDRGAVRIDWAHATGRKGRAYV